MTDEELTEMERLAKGWTGQDDGAKHVVQMLNGIPALLAEARRLRGERTAVEVRASELAQDCTGMNVRELHGWQDFEFAPHAGPPDYSGSMRPNENQAAWHTGFLARAIATHEEE